MRYLLIGFVDEAANRPSFVNLFCHRCGSRRRPKLRWTLHYFVAVALWTLVFPAIVPAQIQGDHDALYEVIESLESNMQSIVTWRGRVEATSVWTDSRGGERTSSTNIAFVYEDNGSKLRFSATERRLSGGNTVIKSEGLRTADSYIRSGPYTLDDPKGLNAHTKLIVIDELTAERPGPMSPDFDPFTYIGLNGRDPLERLKFFYENRALPNMSNLTVAASSSVVTVDFTLSRGVGEWRYSFDIEKGGLPFRVVGEFHNPERSTVWENEYIQVDGVWIPSTTSVSHASPDRSWDRSLVWSDQRVNDPVDPKEFTISALDQLPGNTVWPVRKKMSHFLI